MIYRLCQINNFVIIKTLTCDNSNINMKKYFQLNFIYLILISNSFKNTIEPIRIERLTLSAVPIIN